MNRYLLLFTLIISFINAGSQEPKEAMLEDIRYINSEDEAGKIFFRSKYVDFLQIPSSISDSVKSAIVVYKPKIPSRILLLAHGWHGSVKPPSAQSENPYPDFLSVQVDMRGRKYSTGQPDCNGFELYDFFDAYKYVIRNYREYISDTSQVYYLGGSGGGGNGYAILGKFPDLFCSAVIYCGISDYKKWFEGDSIGEFRDEMIPWIGCSPQENPEAYRSRSGITTVSNILTPVYIVHGETDIRVPVSHAREFVEEANKYKKVIHYVELKNVGTRNHWGNISKQQEKRKNDLTLQGFKYRMPPVLPDKGELVVAGYVVTKHFSVFLDSIDSVGLIKYNLRKREIKFLKGKGVIIWE